MSILFEPLEEDQAKLLNIVWDAFGREDAQWPVFGYIEFHMRKLGLDARSVLGGLPFIGRTSSRDGSGYRAVGFQASGGILSEEDRIYLTMAGLYHIRDHSVMPIIGAVLAYLRQITRSQNSIGDSPFAVPNVNVSLREALKSEGEEESIMPWAAAIVEHEWPGISVVRRSGSHDTSGRLGLLREANFYTIDEYLVALTAVTTPQQKTTVLEYRDPRAVLRTIDHFDITCELVLKQPLVTKPAMSRSAFLTQQARSHNDLQSGLSAFGEIIGELQVPGKNPNYSTGRLLGWVQSQLPNLDPAASARIQIAVNLLDAVRELRNSGQHPKQKKQLIAAHDLLGLPFPIQDPGNAWDVIRAQMDVAFGTLQEEILAAR